MRTVRIILRKITSSDIQNVYQVVKQDSRCRLSNRSAIKVTMAPIYRTMNDFANELHVKLILRGEYS
ncbi:hypothetical protein [Bacillus solitudinis]|uniref:hypothetical protein n=1 Tax=Bacillus solitudinis TaxID=2014074 RepID=UPI000C2375F5|nr:hypothetical protein [Bacillus solitudinis]